MNENNNPLMNDNNNIEKLRDSLAGGVLGGAMSVVILILSLLRAAVSSIFGSGFHPMSGTTLILLFLALTAVGAGLGYGYGVYMTKDHVVQEQIQNWLIKHNH